MAPQFQSESIYIAISPGHHLSEWLGFLVLELRIPSHTEVALLFTLSIDKLR